MTAYDIPQLQEKYAELKHDIMVMQNENTLLKRKNTDLEYKLECVVRRVVMLENRVPEKALAELWDTPEEDEAWAHLRAGD